MVSEAQDNFSVLEVIFEETPYSVLAVAWICMRALRTASCMSVLESAAVVSTETQW